MVTLESGDAPGLRGFLNRCGFRPLLVVLVVYPVFYLGAD